MAIIDVEKRLLLHSLGTKIYIIGIIVSCLLNGKSFYLRSFPSTDSQREMWTCCHGCFGQLRMTRRLFLIVEKTGIHHGGSPRTDDKLLCPFLLVRKGKVNVEHRNKALLINTCTSAMALPIESRARVAKFEVGLSRDD